MIDRQILKYHFTTDDFPVLQCPRCASGTLNPECPLDSFEPPFSKRSQAFHYSEMDWIKLRLVGKLYCSNSTCGQLVGFSADGCVDFDIDEQGGQIYDHFFKFKYIHPPINIIEIPKETPSNIKQPILSAFDTYWNNIGLCANAIRQAMENLLDLHGVSRLSMKGRRLPFGQRIKKLNNSNPEYAHLFELFLPLLNAGSHGDEINKDSLLDVMEALEIHLSTVFDSRENRLLELRENLQKTHTGFQKFEEQ